MGELTFNPDTDISKYATTVAGYFEQEVSYE
jgi:hypothetical protein